MQVLEWLLGISGSIISFLLLGNIFFLKKLIQKVDLIDPLVVNITNLAKRLDELCGRVDLINDLRIEVASLRAKLGTYFYREYRENKDKHI
jgi:hypothetical protein